MKRGSVLLLVLWLIAVLSVIIVSFAFEAHQQAGVNVYLRERNRVNRLIEPGKMIGEAILLGYTEAKEYTEGEDTKQLDEDDRFYLEKRNLKYATRCTVGPILMDEDDEDSGLVTIDIELANSGAENGININELYSGGDKNWALRWQMILRHSGVPEELEVEVKDADGRGTETHNLMNHLLACWNDWRDDDDQVSAGPLTESEYKSKSDDGAEKDFYQEYYEELEKDAHGREERERAKEDRRYPRNGSIPDIKELGYVRGFRDFPSILRGGLLYDGTDREEEFKGQESEENPRLTGIASFFGTSGTSKIVINPQTTVDQLMTIPGIFPEDQSDESAAEDAQALAKAILDGLKIKPEEYDVDETRDWWPYKDMTDLQQRLDETDLESGISLGNEANEYIEWQPSEKSLFKMKITGESMGMKRVVECECYVKDKKVRYLKWSEN